jgi:hypothetical protein
LSVESIYATMIRFLLYKLSEHTQTDDGLTEDNVDVSQGTQAQGTVVEDEIFFEHLLGIRIPHDINSDRVGLREVAQEVLANQIAHRICSGIDVTRHGIDEAGLTDMLNRNIQRALEGMNRNTDLHGHAHGGHEHHDANALSNPERLQELRAVADAVRESIPSNLIIEYVRKQMPAILPGKDANLPVNVMQISDCNIGGEDRKMTINMNHAFWREFPYTNRDALRDALRANRILNTLGIATVSPPVTYNYPLTDLDIENILDAKMWCIDLQKNVQNVTVEITAGGLQVPAIINVRDLVRHRVDGTPPVFAGTLQQNAISALFDDNLIWRQYVRLPYGVLPGQVMPADRDRLVNELFNAVNSTGGSLLLTNQNTFELQQQIFEQHQFDTRIREGSDNVIGAAVAISLAAQHHDLRASMTGRDRAAVAADLNTARANQQFAQLLESAEALVLPTGLHSYEDLEGARDAIIAANAIAGSIPVGQQVTIAQSGSIPAETMIVPAKSGQIADYGPIFAWLAKKSEEIRNELKPYREIEAKFLAIRNLCTFNGITGTAIQVISDAARANPRDTTQINQAMNIGALTDAIRGIRNFGGKSKADFDKDIERLQKEEVDIAAGRASGPHGDVAQHFVIKEYLKRYRGLTESDATAATNYMRGRAKIDGDLTQAAEQITSELVGHERLSSLSDYFSNIPNTLSFLPNSPERNSRRIIYQIAYASHVPMKPNRYNRSIVTREYYRQAVPQPNWSKASYSSLIESYFAMKKLYEGGGPSTLKLQQTNYLMAQMNQISKALLAKHSQTLLKDFGPSLGIGDEQQQEMLKNPTKEEHIRLLSETLKGNPPAKYNGKIDHAIHFADHHTSWVRRTLLTNEKYGMIYGRRNKISARSLLFGNKYMSAVGLGYRIPVGIAQSVTKGTTDVAVGAWKRKWAIAGGALIGTLFLPGIGTAIGATIAGANTKVASGGGHIVASSLHDAHGGDGHGNDAHADASHGHAA